MQPWFEAAFWRERELPAGLLGFDAAGGWAPAAQVDVLVGVIVQLGAAGVRVRFTPQESSDRQAFAEVPGVSGGSIRMAEPRTKAGAPTRGALLLGCCGIESMNRMWKASTRLRNGHRRILLRHPTQPFTLSAGRVDGTDGVEVSCSGGQAGVPV